MRAGLGADYGDHLAGSTAPDLSRWGEACCSGGVSSGPSEPLGGATSTARLKSDADTRKLNGPSWARRDFRPTFLPTWRETD